MSGDNTWSRFESWNRQGPNADTRHWDPQATDNTWDSEFSSLSDEWTTHQTLTQLEQMLKSSDPKVRALATQIVSEKAGAAARLKEHNERRVEALKNQVGRPDKHKRGWDSLAITREARRVLEGK